MPQAGEPLIYGGLQFVVCGARNSTQRAPPRAFGIKEFIIAIDIVWQGPHTLGVWDLCDRAVTRSFRSASLIKTSQLTILFLFFVEECFVTNIYVGNLSFDASEDDLREAFSQFGQVSSVNIISDRETGRSRGFAFVEMPNSEEAKTAIEVLNLKQIAGRAVNVNEARPKPDRPRGGRGGGGGGGGGRGRW